MTHPQSAARSERREDAGAPAYPLVLVPALGSDERLWQSMIGRLDVAVETLVIRGVGDTIAAMADSVVEQAPERFYLAGNSMGGYVALEVVLRHKDRVAGLALLNTSAIAAPPDRRDRSLELIEMVENSQFEDAVARISSAVAAGRRDVRELAAAMALDLGPQVFTQQQRAVLDRRDLRAALTELDVPTIVLAGGKDVITPLGLGKELARLISGAELVLLDGVGHLSSLEDPDAVAFHLTRWLRENGNGPPPHRADGRPAHAR